MGLVIHATVVCDNCNVNQSDLQSVDAPLPDQWLKAQGYANIFGGSSAAITGYFCPSCIASQGTRALVKKAADICEDLTAAPTQ